jgi:hypothetical protein
VLLVFEDRTDSGMLSLLRPGFRHCFCLVGSGTDWIVCDPLKTRIELAVVTAAAERLLAEQLTRSGRTVLRGRVHAERKSQALRLRAVTCVEVVMRVLNLDAAGVLTHYQLFRRLLDPVDARDRFTVHGCHDSFALDGDAF